MESDSEKFKAISKKLLVIAEISRLLLFPLLSPFVWWNALSYKLTAPIHVFSCLYRAQHVVEVQNEEIAGMRPLLGGALVVLTPHNAFLVHLL